MASVSEWYFFFLQFEITLEALNTLPRDVIISVFIWKLFDQTQKDFFSDIPK